MQLFKAMLSPYFALSVIAGAVLPLQAGINATLRGYLGHPLRASLGNFVVGTIIISVLMVTVRAPWPALHEALRGPWWMWLGGALGSVYVISTIVALPRLGASITFALIVAGQMIASLAIDRAGLFGAAAAPLSITRLAGACMLVVAVYLLQR